MIKHLRGMIMFYVEKLIDNDRIYIRDTKDMVLECYTLNQLKQIYISFDLNIIGFKGTSVIENTCFRLMNKTKVIGEFCIDSNNDYSDFDILDNNLPIDFSSLKSWIESRKIFTCARDINEFFSMLGINSISDFIKIFHCISLHDTFWVNSLLNGHDWLSVSPYHNDYSKFVSQYSMDGIIGKKDFNYLSPDIATSGSFPSTWRFKSKDNIEYIKGSSKYTLGGINSGREPYSEYYACKVAEYLNFNCVDYKIRNYTRGDGKKDIVTVCKAYTSLKYGSVTANKLGLNSYKDVIEYCKKNLDVDSVDTILNMLFLDCLLLNTDRHFSNIEFLFDNDTLKIISISPIYDNNFALLPRFLEYKDVFIRKDYIARSGETFEEVFELVSSYKNFKNILLKLKSFKFDNIKQCPISSDRLKFLNEFLQSQVSYLLRRC